MPIGAVVHELRNEWSWKECKEGDLITKDGLVTASKEGWTAASSFPSEIHLELLKQGSIPDPFLGFNEHEVQWIGEREWLYRCAYSYQGDLSLTDTFVEMEFLGLDTFCEVYLNGEKIVDADNMFRTYAVTVKSSRLRSSKNDLILHFKSAQVIAKNLEAKFGRVRAGSTNLGDPSRVYVRKAQYDWRWDWGPELMTCGPYRPIRLNTYTTKLVNIAPFASVSAAPDLMPSFRLDVTLGGDLSAVRGLRCIIKDVKANNIVKDEQVEFFLQKAQIVAAVSYDHLPEIKLWWPVGYGEQQLYTLEVILLGSDGFILDRSEKCIGFRRIELIQESLETPDRYGTGTTFLFEVNGVRMFMGGSNWIPADNLLTRISPKRYRDWLTLLRDGNQNMVRIWGGGIYEPDVFYDVCDELGILVWQDFQFACGVYPAHEAFLESVRREAEDNIIRLRTHASLALFCGNNEDYQMVLQWGDVAELPARLIYEDLLPGLVTALSTTSPTTPYHRGSPYGGKGWDTADPTVGDIHQWEIWGGKERPWQDYWRMGGRFVSQFGIPAMPDVKTVDYWLAGNVNERHIQSKMMSQHCRAGAHDRRFAIVMSEMFRPTEDLETYIYYTQIMQSEALGLAYRSWRREWRGPGKQYCGGVLVWQMNDCWPVTSWAIADYFLRPKAAYYTIARELKPFNVGIFRSVKKNRDNDRPVQFYEFGAFQSESATIDVWATNSTLMERLAILELYAFDLESEWILTEKHDVILHSNQTTELLSIPCPEPRVLTTREARTRTRSHSVIIHARLLDSSTGAVLSRFSDWPQPYRFVDFPTSLDILQIHVAGERLTIHVDKPVKGLNLSVIDADVSGPPVIWSDNNLDLFPGDPQTVFATGLNGRSIEVRMMGSQNKQHIQY